MKYNELYIKRIRSFCTKRNISINQLSVMSGVSQSTINNIMQGDVHSPGTVTLHKIANAFNMTLSEFLNFEELNNYSFDDEEHSNE